jgi:hypothetical protein
MATIFVPDVSNALRPLVWLRKGNLYPHTNLNAPCHETIWHSSTHTDDRQLAMFTHKAV